MLTTSEQQKQRWIKHFKVVLNQPNPPHLYNFDGETAQPELGVNTDNITEEEVKNAIITVKRKDEEAEAD